MMNPWGSEHVGILDVPQIPEKQYCIFCWSEYCEFISTLPERDTIVSKREAHQSCNYHTVLHWRPKRTVDSRTVVTNTVSRVTSLLRQGTITSEIFHRSGLNLQQTLRNGYKTGHPNGTATCLTYTMTYFLEA
jgi:hypothetical protein